MKASAATAAFVVAGGSLVQAVPYDADALRSTVALLARALPANSPHGYKPQTGDCPSDRPTIRNATSLSPQELSWLPSRRNQTIQPMRDLLGRLNITGLDTNSYIDNNRNNASALPNIGVAVSGGGYRAMLNGAGVLEAFDSRTSNSTSAGQLGGLLQSATYLAGLSGGSWLVGSLYTNNFTSIDDILATDNPANHNSDFWQLSNSIFSGPGNGILDSADYYGDLVSDVHDKSDAGFNTTLTDYWGRALSYQLVNASNGGPDFTFSSIADQQFFTNGSVPLPLIVTDERPPGQQLISSNATIMTINPWEIGSDDPTLYAFAPLKYAGTNFSAGSPATDQCVTGFDNVGFVMGTSSTLFNEALIKVNGTNTTGLFSSALRDALEAILKDFGEDENDISDWPNPFYGYNNATNQNAHDIQLTLVDGGEDKENIPLNPLIQPNRHVDVIFAVDSSADTTDSSPADGSAANWPGGISMVATYQRSLSHIQNGTAFPSVPDENTFYNLGLNNRPTFFGCNASNLTGEAPLIVYLPNAPYVYNSNVSTYDLEYDDEQRNAIVLNAYNGATQGNSSLDSEWPACVGCAILSRSLNRTGTAVPEICNSCFNRYCWNGTVDSSTPAVYDPPMKMQSKAITLKSAAHPAATVSYLLLVSSAILAAGIALM